MHWPSAVLSRPSNENRISNIWIGKALVRSKTWQTPENQAQNFGLLELFGSEV